MAKQPRVLSGKVVAVTGAARGIGRATAAALVRERARVAIGDLDLELTRRTAAELGGGCVAFELDVTDRVSFAAFVDAVEAQLGALDVIVNNAGIMPIGPFVEEADETADRMIDINLRGVITGTKLALRTMLPRDAGHIVNVASSAGKGGFPGGATYCATKHAVVGLSEAVRAETYETGVEVSCVMPAVVNTELAHGLVQSRFVKKVEPEDVAEAIVEALRFPRFDVFVPKSIGPLSQFMNVLPRRGREGIARLLKADKVLAEADPRARASYEHRAAHSEPSRPPAGDRASADERREEVAAAP